MARFQFNPTTEEAVVYDPAQKKWNPTPVAKNEIGDYRVFDGNKWRSVIMPRPQEGPYASPEKSQEFKGSLLPISRTAEGKSYFDPSAGILGVATRGYDVSRDVMQGKIDPRDPKAIEGAINIASLATPLAAASRAAVVRSGLLGGGPVKRKAPTAKQLKKEAVRLSKKFDEMDVSYSSQSIAELTRSIEQSFSEKAILDSAAPKTFGVLRGLQAIPKVESGAAVIVKAKMLNAARKQLNKIGSSPDATEKFAAAEAIRAIDDFLLNPNPQSLVPKVAGQTALTIDDDVAEIAVTEAKSAAEILKESQANFAAGFRVERLVELDEILDLRAASVNSGRNVDNKTRQALVSFINSKKQIRGFDEKEKQAITDIILGTKTKNAIRAISNWLGGGGGLGAHIPGAIGGTVGAAIDAAIGGPGAIGAIAGYSIPQIVGIVSRNIVNSMTRKELRKLTAMVSSRSPLAAKGVPISPNRIIEEALLKGFLANIQQPSESKWPSAFPRPVVGPFSSEPDPYKEPTTDISTFMKPGEA